MDYLIVILLVVLSGLFSGLTLGFFSLNRDDLARKAKLGNRQAQKVFAIRQNGNQLLCSLLLGNVAVNAAISIVLNSLVSGLLAGIMATALIVTFGEILPQAAFARYALKTAAFFSGFVRVIMLLSWPITKPLALLLDKVLGDEMAAVYSRRELIKIIEEHEDSSHSDLDADEEKIIKGALSYSDKQVKDIMTPRTEMYALEAGDKLTKKAIDEIFKSGHSRIPVYVDKRDNIIGILYVKDLIKVNGERPVIGEIAREDVIYVDENKRLDDLLNAFKKTRHHLFVVLDDMGMVSGLVTIEDVIEEIIGAEIVDEFDRHADLRALAKSRMKKKNIV